MDDLFGSFNEPTATMSMMTNDPFAVDPAAEFLAQQQVEMDRLENNVQTFGFDETPDIIASSNNNNNDINTDVFEI